MSLINTSVCRVTLQPLSTTLHFIAWIDFCIYNLQFQVTGSAIFSSLVNEQIREGGLICKQCICHVILEEDFTVVQIEVAAKRVLPGPPGSCRD